MERRNTIQKNLVLNAVTDMKSHVTAQEVYEYIIKDYPTLGKGTVYRNLGILADEGKIKKITIPDGPDRFDFTLKDHYHVRCVRCGTVSDVDIEIIPDLIGKIGNKHGMKYLDYDVLFRGICKNCQ